METYDLGMTKILLLALCLSACAADDDSGTWVDPPKPSSCMEGRDDCSRVRQLAQAQCYWVLACAPDSSASTDGCNFDFEQEWEHLCETGEAERLCALEGLKRQELDGCINEWKESYSGSSPPSCEMPACIPSD